MTLLLAVGALFELCPITFAGAVGLLIEHPSLGGWGGVGERPRVARDGEEPRNRGFKLASNRHRQREIDRRC